MRASDEPFSNELILKVIVPFAKRHQNGEITPNCIQSLSAQVLCLSNDLLKLRGFPGIYKDGEYRNDLVTNDEYIRILKEENKELFENDRVIAVATEMIEEIEAKRKEREENL